MWCTLPSPSGSTPAVDLGDPRLRRPGNHTDITHTVHGEARQVSIAVGDQHGGAAYYDVDSGTPAAAVAAPLLVVPTIDAADLG